MWIADSIQIRADQTCWTADGYDGCGVLDSGGRDDGLRDALWDAYYKEQSIQANNNVIMAVMSELF